MLGLVFDADLNLINKRISSGEESLYKHNRFIESITNEAQCRSYEGDVFPGVGFVLFACAEDYFCERESQDKTPLFDYFFSFRTFPL